MDFNTTSSTSTSYTTTPNAIKRQNFHKQIRRNKLHEYQQKKRNELLNQHLAIKKHINNNLEQVTGNFTGDSFGHQPNQSQQWLYHFDQSVVKQIVIKQLEGLRMNKFSSYQQIYQFLAYLTNVDPDSLLREQHNYHQEHKHQQQKSLAELSLVQNILRGIKKCLQKLFSFQASKQWNMEEQASVYTMAYHIMHQFIMLAIKAEKNKIVLFQKKKKQMDVLPELSSRIISETHDNDKNLTYLEQNKNCFENFFTQISDIVRMQTDLFQSKLPLYFQQVQKNRTPSKQRPQATRIIPKSLFSLWKYLANVNHPMITQNYILLYLQEIKLLGKQEIQVQEDKALYKQIDNIVQTFSYFLSNTSNLLEFQLSSQQNYQKSILQTKNIRPTKYSLQVIQQICQVMSSILKSFTLSTEAYSQINISIKQIIKHYSLQGCLILEQKGCLKQLVNFLKEQKSLEKKLLNLEIQRNSPNLNKNISHEQYDQLIYQVVENISEKTQEQIYFIWGRIFAIDGQKNDRTRNNLFLKEIFNNYFIYILAPIIMQDFEAIRKSIQNRKNHQNHQTLSSNQMIPEKSQMIPDRISNILFFLSNLISTDQIVAEKCLQLGLIKEIITLFWHLNNNAKAQAFYCIYNLIVQSQQIMLLMICQIFLNIKGRSHYEQCSILGWLNELFKSALYSNGYSLLRSLKTQILFLYKKILFFLKQLDAKKIVSLFESVYGLQEGLGNCSARSIYDQLQSADQYLNSEFCDNDENEQQQKQNKKVVDDSLTYLQEVKQILQEGANADEREKYKFSNQNPNNNYGNLQHMNNHYFQQQPQQQQYTNNNNNANSNNNLISNNNVDMEI